MSDYASAFSELVAIMARLRNPESGCPWDIEQTHASIARYALEEAYEVVDAIERADDRALCEELGDLALQVVFHARMAQERGAFDIADVLTSINGKMIARHPHVFAQARVESAAEQTRIWEDTKAAERLAKGQTSVLDDVPRALPALARAMKLQKRAARIGFDWTQIEPIFDKLREEERELREAVTSGDQAHMREELGDLLFVVANLARRMEIDPDEALRAANAKFERRFRRVEALASGLERPQDGGHLPLEQLDLFWEQAKREERGP